MSVKATTTVSIAPDSTSARSSSKLSTRAILTLVPSDTLTTLVTDARNSADTSPTVGGLMEPAPPAASHHTDEDEQILHKLGYAQELFRAMGGFQNFAISFTIISILAGCLTSYYIAFDQGGPVAITWGWLLVGLMSTHRRPRDGGDRLGLPDGGRPLLLGVEARQPGWGWFTGWFNLVGQIAVTAAIGYGLAIFGTALFNYWFDYPNTKEYVSSRTRSSCRRCPAEPVPGQHHGDAEHDLGVLAHDRRRIHRARADHRPRPPSVLGYVFTRDGQRLGLRQSAASTSATPSSGTCSGSGLLMSQYTITGFDASAHMAEETHQASRIGRRRDVHVGGRVRGLRLDPAARGHVRDPEHAGRARRPRHRRPAGSGPSP